MNRRVLLFQSEPKSSKILADHFTRSGDKVWITSNGVQASTLVSNEKPDLILVDLHLPGNELSKILRYLQKEFPTIGIIITNRHPDFRREMVAKELGAKIFLRQPFTWTWIENAISKIGRGDTLTVREASKGSAIPHVRIQMRYKITFPYVFLALLFAIVSA